jgi:hypothetical protein
VNANNNITKKNSKKLSIKDGEWPKPEKQVKKPVFKLTVIVKKV